MSKETPRVGHSEQAYPPGAAKPAHDHLDQEYSHFLKRLRKTAGVSHIGLIAYHDENNYPRVDLYALPTVPVHHQNGGGKRLLAALDALNEFADSLSPRLFVNHYLVDPEKHTPQQLRELLEANCQNGSDREFLGFEIVTSPLHKLTSTSGQ